MNIGFEQDLLVRTLCNLPPTELSGLCKDCDCSWEEAYRLADAGLINLRADEREKRVIATITDLGLRYAQDAVLAALET